MIIYNIGFLRRICGHIARSAVRLIPKHQPVPILYGILRGKRWIVSSASYGCWTGTYELEKQYAFHIHVAEDSIVFDIGAHVGFYTLLAAELVGPKGKVFAFEPSPQNIIYLQEHLRLNRIANVTVIQAAVSDSSGPLLFKIMPDSTMGYISENGDIQVNTVCLDTLIEMQEIPLPQYIKIDVEGAEKKVLLGAQVTLAHFHPTLFLATHGENVCRECVNLLEALGYRLKRIDRNNNFERCEWLAYF